MLVTSPINAFMATFSPGVAVDANSDNLAVANKSNFLTVSVAGRSASSLCPRSFPFPVVPKIFLVAYNVRCALSCDEPFSRQTIPSKSLHTAPHSWTNASKQLLPSLEPIILLRVEHGRDERKVAIGSTPPDRKQLVKACLERRTNRLILPILPRHWQTCRAAR